MTGRAKQSLSAAREKQVVELVPGWAGTLSSSPTRSSSQDLEVFNINADGSASVPRYYRFEQLLALPQMTVKTARDPNTQQPATYTGVYLNELIQALQSSPEKTVLSANCSDGYQLLRSGLQRKTSADFSLEIRRESSNRLAEVRA
jgi:hypothetical protein